MKLTLIIPDDLHRKVKATAATRGDTFRSVVIEAFERYLAMDDDVARLNDTLEKARRNRQAQRARRGEWRGPDASTLIDEAREESLEPVEHALSGH